MTLSPTERKIVVGLELEKANNGSWGQTLK